MNAVTFDTLSFVKKLRLAGVPESQAEVQAEVIAGAFNDFQNSKLAELVTKSDLADFKVEIIKWITMLLLGQAALIAALVKLL